MIGSIKNAHTPKLVTKKTWPSLPSKLNMGNIFLTWTERFLITMKGTIVKNNKTAAGHQNDKDASSSGFGIKEDTKGMIANGKILPIKNKTTGRRKSSLFK